MFNQHGYLEPGLHAIDRQELESSFVNGFPHSTTRKDIFKGYCGHFEKLNELVDEFEQFVDGSFASNKNDPGDIDMVVFIDAQTVDSLPHDQQIALAALVAGKDTREEFFCDAYFCLVYPDGHPSADHARTQRKYWMGEFGYDRKDTPKGILHITQRATQG